MADGPGVTPPSGDALRRVVDRLTRDGLLAGPVPAAARATSITADSRTAVAGSLFLAIPGTRTDGHRFVTDAVARGATLVMAEQPADGVPLLLVRDARRAAIAAARAWFDDPEYQAISKHRRAGTTLRFLTLVHDLPPRS